MLCIHVCAPERLPTSILIVLSIPKYTIYVNSFCQSNQLMLNVSARAQGQDCEGELLVSHKYFLKKNILSLTSTC